MKNLTSVGRKSSMSQEFCQVEKRKLINSILSWKIDLLHLHICHTLHTWLITKITCTLILSLACPTSTIPRFLTQCHLYTPQCKEAIPFHGSSLVDRRNKVNKQWKRSYDVYLNQTTIKHSNIVTIVHMYKCHRCKA